MGSNRSHLTSMKAGHHLPIVQDEAERSDGVAPVRQQVLDASIDVLTWRQALDQLGQWAARRESRVVCLCNVHSVISASQDPAFRDVLQQSDMSTPDGMPVAWFLRRLGFVSQQRIAGPDLMWRYCGEAQQRGERIFLYGSTPATLSRLQRRLQEAFPRLRIAGTHSPPFRPLDDGEDAEVTRLINRSGAQLVFVSLGCPKQEHWMHAHRGRVQAVMVGVGAAFDFHAGMVQRAPKWMQTCGLEWLHRLVSDPRRLWRRYLVSNTLYIIGATRQLLGRHRSDLR